MVLVPQQIQQTNIADFRCTLERLVMMRKFTMSHLPIINQLL